jgi:hypothetical protein
MPKMKRPVNLIFYNKKLNLVRKNGTSTFKGRRKTSPLEKGELRGILTLTCLDKVLLSKSLNVMGKG